MKPNQTAPQQFVLPDAVYSPELLTSTIRELQAYIEWHRQLHTSTQTHTSSPPEPTRSAETVLVLQQWLQGQPPTVQALERLVSHLQSLRLPVIYVTLAALPSYQPRAPIINWFRANITPQLLVTFVADSGQGGGVLVRTPTHIYDHSWRQRLTQSRGAIAEILHHV